MTWHTLAVTGAERVNAVHREFAGRTGSGLLPALVWVGAAVAALLGVLLLADHLQKRKEHIALKRAAPGGKARPHQRV